MTSYLSSEQSVVDLATPLGTGQNQQNVINSINSKILSGTALPLGLQNLGTLSVPSYVSALTQLDGEVATEGEVPAFQMMDEFLNLMLDPFVDGRLGNGVGGVIGRAMSFAPDAADHSAARSGAGLRRRAQGAAAGAVPAALDHVGRQLWRRQLDQRQFGRRLEQSLRRKPMALPPAWTTTIRRIRSSALRSAAAAPIGVL